MYFLCKAHAWFFRRQECEKENQEEEGEDEEEIYSPTKKAKMSCFDVTPAKKVVNCFV